MFFQKGMINSMKFEAIINGNNIIPEVLPGLHFINMWNLPGDRDIKVSLSIHP